VAGAYPAFLRRRAALTRYFAAPQPAPQPAPPPARPRIGLPARLGRRKGVDVFLETCRRLRADGVAFEAWMGGGGWDSEDERRAAADFTARHDLTDIVADVDLVPSLEPLYVRTDVVVLPSRRDPLPRVIMEAMCRGIPVVATRVDGIPEMVAEGETGFLVASEDAAGFAAAAARLLADPDLRARMGAAGRARAGQLFSQDAYVAAMLELYRGLLPGRAP
ncbi:MAG: glycosyltransferase, partial [Kiritimatiellia bacterium]